MRWQDAEEVECIGLLHIAHGACHFKYYLVFKKIPSGRKKNPYTARTVPGQSIPCFANFHVAGCHIKMWTKVGHSLVYHPILPHRQMANTY